MLNRFSREESSQMISHEREFSYELINRVMAISEQELVTRLSLLLDAELLYEKGIPPSSTYIFGHAFTREVLYDCKASDKLLQAL